MTVIVKGGYKTTTQISRNLNQLYVLEIKSHTVIFLFQEQTFFSDSDTTQIYRKETNRLQHPV